MDVAIAIAVVGLLIFLAHLFSGIFARTMIPDVLFLILIGLCLGPFLGIITPAQFGGVGRVFTVITLVIILFEGGLELDIDVLKKSLRRTFTLTFISFIITMFGVAMVTLWLTPLDVLLSLMLGAIVGSTSPAVIVPLVRKITLQKETKTVLYLESAISDVLSIVVAFALLEAYNLGSLKYGLMVGRIISSFSLAAILGIASAFGWSIILNKVRTLQNAIFTTPAFVFIVFGLAEMLGYSGYISALAFGITLGNIEMFDFDRPFLEKYIPQKPISLNETEKIFISEVVFLLKSFFFVYVGFSIRLEDTHMVFMGLILTAAIFILRLPVVRFTMDKNLPKSDASFMSALVPKGLAAAVLASVPLQEGITEGLLMQNVSYAVVLFSIIFTSILVFLLDRTFFSKVYGWVFSGYAISTTPHPHEPAKPSDK